MRPKTSNLGLILFLASAMIALAAYFADLHNWPVLAPWLDLLGRSIYGWIPLLSRLLPYGQMYLSAAVVALGFFLLATLIAAPFISGNTNEDRLEKKLKDRSKKSQSSVKAG